MQPAQGRRYRILEVLGSGGFGTVYRAEVVTVTGLRREVALKVLNEAAAQNDDAAKRLRDEARILSNLNHFGIVRVDDLLQLDGRWTMVMELVRGVDCSRILRHNGPPPSSVCLDIASRVARTLHAVSKATGPKGERLSLVHRDVKPANILLTEGGAVKLLDFGVARANVDSREAETQQAYVMGSLPYLAPERYGFEDTPAGDVYALGCVLYELFVGKRFGRTKPSRKAHRSKMREGLHEAWEVLQSEVREDLLPILGEALAFEGSDRPAPRDFAARIEALRHRVSGPTLADWAEREVGLLLTKRDELEPDDLCGRVLTENLSAESMAGPLEDLDEYQPEFTVPEMAPLPTDERPAVEEEPASERPTQVLPSTEDTLDEDVQDDLSEDLEEDDGGVAFTPVVEPSEERPRLSEQPTAPVPEHRAPESPHTPGSKSPMLVLGVGVWAMLLLLVVAAVAVWFNTRPEPQPIEKPSLTDVMEEVQEEPEEFEELEEIEFGDIGEVEIVQELPLPPDGEVDVVERPKPTPRVVDTGGSEPVELDEPEEPGEAEEPAVVSRIQLHGDAEFVTVRGASGSERVVGSAALEPGTYQTFPSFPGGYTVPGPTVNVPEGGTLNLRCSSASRSCAVE